MGSNTVVLLRVACCLLYVSHVMLPASYKDNERPAKGIYGEEYPFLFTGITENRARQLAAKF